VPVHPGVVRLEFEITMSTEVIEEGTDTLASLEHRITRVLELITALRTENQSLKDELAEARLEQEEALKQLSGEQQELNAAKQQAKNAVQELEELRHERKQVKTRIEKLLGQMDLLSNV
jgi:chromosome segregation ATPase